MLETILPKNIFAALDKKVNFLQLNEIRLRQNQPIVVFIGGQPYFLSENGLTGNPENAIFATKQNLEDIIFCASGASIYSVNEQIKNGFIVIQGGIRIGLCGTVVKDDNNNTVTQKDWTSINIRIPHFVKNCSLSVFDLLFRDNTIKNTLIVSPPAAGKTTFIRDFVWQISSHNYCINTFVLDERGEISGMGELQLGKFADVLCFCDKYNGFIQGIRTMSPDLIVTDELGYEEDIKALDFALNCGVCVMATVHANSFENLKQKHGFDVLLKNKYFKRYIFLSTNQGPGTIEGIYDENMSRISYYN